jgi:hypothetical protein
MKKVNVNTIINKSNGGESSWIALLQWLRLLVLSLTRIKVYMAGGPSDEPAANYKKDILLEATKIEKIKVPKLTGMKLTNRYTRWGLMLLFVFVAEFAAGQFANSGNDNVCQGQTKSYGVQLNAGSTYAWSITPGVSGTNWVLTQIPPGNTITVQWLIPGTYTLTVVETNSSGCASDPVQITVTVNDPPVITVAPATICEGFSTPLTASATGNTTSITYQWSPATGLSSTTGATVTASPSVTTTYQVIGINGAGCADTATVTVTVNPKPVLTVVNPAAVCAPATVDLTASGVATSTPTGTLTYWTDAAGTVALANPNAVTTSGTYYIKVTTAAGCTDIQPVTVTVNPLPTPVITPSQDPVCENTGTVIYSTPKVGCNTYSWTVSAGGTIVGSSTGNSIEVQWTSSGTKTVTVTETMCGTGCSKTDSKNFVVTPKPVTTPITHN